MPAFLGEVWTGEIEVLVLVVVIIMVIGVVTGGWGSSTVGDIEHIVMGLVGGCEGSAGCTIRMGKWGRGPMVEDIVVVVMVVVMVVGGGWGIVEIGFNIRTHFRWRCLGLGVVEMGLCLLKGCEDVLLASLTDFGSTPTTNSGATGAAAAHYKPICGPSPTDPITTQINVIFDQFNKGGIRSDELPSIKDVIVIAKG